MVPLAPRRSREWTRETHRHAIFATLQLPSSICQEEEKTKTIHSHKTLVLRSFANDLISHGKLTRTEGILARARGTGCVCLFIAQLPDGGRGRVSSWFSPSHPEQSWPIAATQ